MLCCCCGVFYFSILLIVLPLAQLISQSMVLLYLKGTVMWFNSTAACCFPECCPSRPEQCCFVRSLHRRGRPQRQVSTSALESGSTYVSGYVWEKEIIMIVCVLYWKRVVVIFFFTAVKRFKYVFVYLPPAGLEILLKGIWWWGLWLGPVPGLLWLALSSQHVAQASSRWQALPDFYKPLQRTTSSPSCGSEMQIFIFITETQNLHSNC